MRFNILKILFFIKSNQFQAIESDEDIPPVSISSLSGEDEGEDEDESDYDSSSDEELRDDQFFEPTEGMWDDGEEGMGQVGDKENAEATMQDFFRPEEGEGAKFGMNICVPFVQIIIIFRCG